MALVLTLLRPLMPHAAGVLPALLSMLALVPLGAATYAGVHLIVWSLKGQHDDIEGQAIGFLLRRIGQRRAAASA
jgi:hypothetical protein